MPSRTTLQGICPVCRKTAPVRQLWIANQNVMAAHGPRRNRCDGRGQQPVRIVRRTLDEATEVTP